LIDVQHGVFMNATWQNPLVVAATHAHEVLGTQIVGVNEAVRQNFPEEIRDQIAIIPNGSDPGRVTPLIGRDEMKRRHGLPLDSKIAMFVGRISGEKNVQALVDAIEFLDESWRAIIIGPQYVPLERLNPRIHVITPQRRVGNWLAIAGVLCHPADYESHCFTINEAWLASVPIVSCDYPVNQMFEARHGQMMWLTQVRPESEVLATSIEAAFQGGPNSERVRRARRIAALHFSAPVMGRRWTDLVESTFLARAH
jgi:glycosyltransferase involved in cell wall biosynthesis